jgi:hypothetical protein
MNYKNIPSSTISDLQVNGRQESDGSGTTIRMRLENLLTKMGFHLPGETEIKASAPDPAFQVIMQIEDVQVRSLVRMLHYRTPRSLKAMREACQKCFILPEDCPYIDYSIFDVKKAVKQVKPYPLHIGKEVIKELAKVNTELAGHLRESLLE